jgi:protoporphyrinogen oxidase
MGLAAAYRAAKNGHQVDVIEASSEPGGMAGHFDFDGISIERFYHFVCRTDYPTFELMQELGISDLLHWRTTSMGFFNRGKLYPWGNPLALLKFPGIGIIDKLRYGIFAFICVRRDSWGAIESETAKHWIIRWCGHTIYERFWKTLLDYKFYEYADNISATWIWTRIRRIGRSRKSIFQEELGFIEGGTMTLVNALIRGIEAHGGRVHVNAPAQHVLSENGRVTGVQTGAGVFAADHVICTVPTPFVSRLVPELPADWKAKYDEIHNIGCICVIFKLKRSVTPHFWVNISEPGLEIPGVIEFTNLRSVGGDTIVYVPYYMPTTHEKFGWPDDDLLGEGFACLQRINSTLVSGDIICTKVARLKYGQPICEPDFASKLPPIQTPIAGLQIADTCYYYPEDRGIAESVQLGAAMAEALGKA